MINIAQALDPNPSTPAAANPHEELLAEVKKAIYIDPIAYPPKAQVYLVRPAYDNDLLLGEFKDAKTAREFTEAIAKAIAIAIILGQKEFG